jgi:cell division protein FtsZ
MTINLSVPKADNQLKPRITVVGVGGAGGNAVNNMINAQLEGVEFIAANTDAQALISSLAPTRLQLGINITHGLGAGSRPDIGRAAAEEALDEIIAQLQSAHMVFIAAGMGGGTGTGAAPVIARLAREHGILTVGVVTKPFNFEGMNRMRVAEAGIAELQQYVDTLIVIPNQNLFRVANEKTTFADAFAMADEVLYSGVRGITDLMVVPGLINLDFADIRTIMSEMGKAMMGTGEAEGEDRARRAAEAAISNPLLDDVSMKGARGVLINITGGPDLSLFEVDEAANRIGDEVDTNASIIFGSTIDPALQGKVRVSIVATGIEANGQMREPRPVLRVVTELKAQAQQSRAGSGGAEPRPAAMLAELTPARMPEPDAPKAPAVDPAPASIVAAVQVAESIEVKTAEAAGAAAPEPAPAPVPAADAKPAKDAFVPPAAVQPRAAQAADRPADRTVRPAAPPPLDQAGGRKATSLFQRMTGVGRTRPQAPEPAEPRLTGTRPVATLRDATIKPAPAPHPEQPRLDGIDPQDRVRPSQPEEDLLDIPAFLRRQAN